MAQSNSITPEQARDWIGPKSAGSVARLSIDMDPELHRLFRRFCLLNDLKIAVVARAAFVEMLTDKELGDRILAKARGEG